MFKFKEAAKIIAQTIAAIAIAVLWILFVISIIHFTMKYW